MEEGNESFFGSQACQNTEFDPTKGLQPLMIRQLLDAEPITQVTQDNEKTVFVLNGQPLRKCMLVANVYVTNKGRRGINYGLDDSTGRIMANTQSFEGAITFDTFAYARVIGTLSRWNGVNRLEVDLIRPVFDFYEVYHHILSSIQSIRETLPPHIRSLGVTQKPLPSSVNSLTKETVSAEATDSQPYVDIVQTQQVTNFPGVLQPQESPYLLLDTTLDIPPIKKDPALSGQSLGLKEARKLRSKIRKYVLGRQSDYVDTDRFDGILIDDIVVAMRHQFPGVTPEDLSEAIEDLVTSNKIYSTIDDSHYAAHPREGTN